jgi:hypothetical protein
VTKRIKHACGHQRLHDMSSFLLVKLEGGGGAEKAGNTGTYKAPKNHTLR